MIENSKKSFSDPDSVLIIIGDGPLAFEVRKKAGEKVLFLGPVDDEVKQECGSRKTVFFLKKKRFFRQNIMFFLLPTCF